MMSISAIVYGSMWILSISSLPKTNLCINISVLNYCLEFMVWTLLLLLNILFDFMVHTPVEGVHRQFCYLVYLIGSLLSLIPYFPSQLGYFRRPSN